jgi:hypothetical protein
MGCHRSPPASPRPPKIAVHPQPTRAHSLDHLVGSGEQRCSIRNSPRPCSVRKAGDRSARAVLVKNRHGRAPGHPDRRAQSRRAGSSPAMTGEERTSRRIDHCDALMPALAMTGPRNLRLHLLAEFLRRQEMRLDALDSQVVAHVRRIHGLTKEHADAGDEIGRRGARREDAEPRDVLVAGQPRLGDCRQVGLEADGLCVNLLPSGVSKKVNASMRSVIVTLVLSVGVVIAIGTTTAPDFNHQTTAPLARAILDGLVLDRRPGRLRPSIFRRGYSSGPPAVTRLGDATPPRNSGRQFSPARNRTAASAV